MDNLVTLQPAPVLQTPYEGPLDVRAASLRDVQGILHLINTFAAKGIMLPRTEFEMAENIRDFVVLGIQNGWRRAGRCISIRRRRPRSDRSLSIRCGRRTDWVGR